MPVKSPEGIDIPSFIGNVVFGGDPNRKGGQLVQEEVQPVIIVEHNNNSGIKFLNPVVNRLEAIEPGLPIRIVMLFVMNSSRYCRNVR